MDGKDVDFVGTQLNSGRSSINIKLGFVGVVAILITATMVHSYDVDRTRRQRDRDQQMEVAAEALLQSRTQLNFYLLSGDPRAVDHVQELQSRGEAELNQLAAATNDSSLSTEITRLIENESSWRQRIADPLINARKQLDSGHGTLVDVQIKFLQTAPENEQSELAQRLKRVRELLNSEGE